ncbi:MAG TPA: ankyrin repeat domain-containing protein [Elusimicrobiota bacterium]|nr:ankyrin repeat domain-containing protein [Elusimicrobiota bacterium]
MTKKTFCRESSMAAWPQILAALLLAGIAGVVPAKAADIGGSDAMFAEQLHSLSEAVVARKKDVARAAQRSLESARGGNGVGAELLDAVGDGDLNKVQALLDRGANVNFKGANPRLLHYKTTALILAVENRNARMVRLLLSRHADVSEVAGGSDALSQAVAEDSLPIAKLLLKRYAGSKAELSALLNDCSYPGGGAMFELLEKYGAVAPSTHSGRNSLGGPSDDSCDSGKWVGYPGCEG